ncbi:acyltransferase family protein [Methylocapsa palsarum]|uniref:Peptidoglycan/LPS O-acetylase OafA/YrhL, contains acyltransferase and SGNH-hydrolase domains n=1 Tax=Methylocapsa palsarum TaxID=1612308 RepID=A0A1I4BFR9_9HYPH|nr:acyltransferase [Methylocapsa palsarum]SFK66861.1 Peptidoglycan/LPS O-acetylase OafA/YrhL, contains acyltransferase and SGNH-hydrolase domains [Methylocapsa palsarum]
MARLGVERDAQSRNSLEGIQVLRAAAALLVVLLHTLAAARTANARLTIPDWLAQFGAIGVDIFFVISGFIMFRVSFPAGRPALAPASFLRKRLTRIYPVYWFVMALMLELWSLGLLPLAHLNAEMIDAENQRMLIRSIFLLPTNYFVMAIAWTLVYEMYFYFIFGATLYFSNPLVSLLGASATIMILYAAHGWVPDPALSDFLRNPIAIEFCFGLLMGYLAMRWPRLAFAAKPLWIPAAALLAIAAFAQPYASAIHPPSLSRVLQWGVPSFLLVASFLSMKSDSGPLRRQMILLGDASYAIYLTHPIAMIYYAKLLQGNVSSLPQWPIVPLIIVLSAGFGVVIHVVVERRLMSGVRGLFGGRIASSLARPPLSPEIAQELESTVPDR